MWSVTLWSHPIRGGRYVPICSSPISFSLIQRECSGRRVINCYGEKVGRSLFYNKISLFINEIYITERE